MTAGSYGYCGRLSLVFAITSPVLCRRSILTSPTPNQGDKPRLDVLFTMHDGSWVRYHPSAEPIWSHGPLPTDAMTQRYNRARKIARKT